MKIGDKLEIDGIEYEVVENSCGQPKLQKTEQFFRVGDWLMVGDSNVSLIICTDVGTIAITTIGLHGHWGKPQKVANKFKIPISDLRKMIVSSDIKKITAEEAVAKLTERL